LRFHLKGEQCYLLMHVSNKKFLEKSS